MRLLVGLSWVLSAVLLSGCTSFMSWLTGLHPVTEERCQKLNMFQIGLTDGETVQRQGEKFFFWDKDCRLVGVKLNRPDYDRGYEQGLKTYCSCERGFEAGVREEYLELKGQYAICRKAEYRVFELGYKAGKGRKIPSTEIPSQAIEACGVGSLTPGSAN